MANERYIDAFNGQIIHHDVDGCCGCFYALRSDQSLWVCNECKEIWTREELLEFVRKNCSHSWKSWNSITERCEWCELHRSVK